MKLRSLGFSLLGLAWAIAGCSRLGCEGSRPSPAPSTAPDPAPSPGPRLQTLTPLGAASSFDGPHNGLSPEALRQSPALLAYLGASGLPLTSASLATAATAAAFAAALDELYPKGPPPKVPPACGTGTASCASKLMGYIVSCALDAGTSVELHPTGEPLLRWTGELGVCGDKAADVSDHWASHAPTRSCLEAVSACVLARVNALDLRVAISLRGGPGLVVPPLRARVPLEPTLREHDGTARIASLDPTCAATAGDPTRNCGWDRRYVGRCAPGTHVSLENPGGAMVRVCKGIHGCDHGAAPAPYAGLVTEVPSTATRVEFDCPSPGTPRPYYYFGIMVAADNPAVLPAPAVDVTLPAPLPAGADYRYPATEAEVFTYREGAFYGNLFTASPPTPAQPEGGSPPSALLGNQYACYSSLWNDGIAELTGRMCARSGGAGSCFGNYPYPCLDPAVGPPSPLPNSCGSDPGKPSGSYLDCKGFVGAGPRPTPTSTAAWPRALTILLNDPCDFAAAQGCSFGR